MDKEEKKRQDRIQRAKRLENNWKPLNLCRTYIKENSQAWKDSEDICEKQMEEMMRRERIQVAHYKKEKHVRNHLRKMKNPKITDMLKELPKKDQERWRKEMRIQEYRQETQQTEERKAKKRKLEDHWDMMRWLVKYIEDKTWSSVSNST